MNINDDFSELAKPVERVTPVHPKNILAPIDSDDSAAEEIDYAIGLAEHYDADLWLMPITRQLGIAADVRALSSYVHDSWSHRTQIQLWDLVLEARRRHYRTFPISACCGNGAEQILRAAERLKADLIVLRRYERSGTLAGLTWPEADAVFRQAKSPIMMATTHEGSPSVTNLHSD
jgi:nucleotide-binding universal stress UspA family protein